MKFCSYHFIIASVLLLCSYSIYAQDVYKDQRSAWLQKAEDSKPVLIETIKQPVTLVTLIQDNNVFQHWKAVKSKPIDSLYNNSFKKQSGVVVDFGEHLTGYFTFSVEEMNRAADAPLRIKLLLVKCLQNWQQLSILIPAV
jgi:hypothetical protein